MICVKLSPEAEKDIENIGDYIAVENGAPIAAESFIKKLREAIFSLDTLPNRGVEIRTYSGVGSYRYIVCEGTIPMPFQSAKVRRRWLYGLLLCCRGGCRRIRLCR